MNGRHPTPGFTTLGEGGASVTDAVGFSQDVRPMVVHVVVARSWRSVLPGLVTFLIACILTGPFSQRFPGTLLRFSFELASQQYNVTMPLLALLTAVLLVRPLFLLYDSIHTITSHHVRSTLGRCSLKRINIEVTYEDMRGVSFSQSLQDRILGVGTIFVWTASNANPEISMRGVGDPEMLVEIIRTQIDQNRIRRHLVTPEPSMATM